MAYVIFAAFDASGAPLTGLTPSWSSAYDAVTGSTIGSPPAISELSGGLYKFTKPSQDITGIIDAGATAVPRYLSVIASSVGTVPAFNAAQAPLTGQSPDFSTLVDVSDGSAVSKPLVNEVGGGMYKFTLPNPNIHSAGIIDLKAGAVPRYAVFDSASDIDGPVVQNLVPASLSVLQRTQPVTFDVVDDIGVGIVAVWIKFSNDRRTILVYDGASFVYPFDTLSTVSGPATLRSFSILPVFGWESNIDSLTIRAADGNVDVV